MKQNTMKYIWAIAAAMLLAAAFSSAYAQPGKRWYIDAGWQFNGTPGSKVAESAQGLGAYLEGGYYVRPKLAVGAFVNYGTNSSYFPKETFMYPDGSALTTDYSNAVFQVPFGATLRYRFTRSKFQPYAEARLGANWSRQSTYMSTFRLSGDNWGFYASPEVGFTWHPFNRSNFGFQLAAYYSYATNRNDFYGMNGINNVGFKLGLSF